MECPQFVFPGEASNQFPVSDFQILSFIHNHCVKEKFWIFLFLDNTSGFESKFVPIDVSAPNFG